MKLLRRRDVQLVVMGSTIAPMEFYRKHYDGFIHEAPRSREGVLALMASCDVLALPTIPFVTPPLVAPDCSLEENMGAALDMIGNTAPFDVSGHPAISVPCGVADDLPIGLMLVGRQFEDLTVLQAAHAVEASGDWRSK